jgi:hypothetical protein
MASLWGSGGAPQASCASVMGQMAIGDIKKSGDAAPRETANYFLERKRLRIDLTQAET